MLGESGDVTGGGGKKVRGCDGVSDGGHSRGLGSAKGFLRKERKGRERGKKKAQKKTNPKAPNPMEKTSREQRKGTAIRSWTTFGSHREGH